MVFNEENAKKRFWARVHIGSPDECWEFDNPGIRKGEKWYGNVTFHNKQYKAHRLAYILMFGEIDSSSVHVLHRCDNPPCCNPSHLFLGTHQDNMKDMVTKGRSSHKPKTIGSEHGLSKLKDSDIPEIFNFRAQGLSYTKIAAQFNVSFALIRNVLKGENWSHVLSSIVLPDLGSNTAKGEASGSAKMTEENVLSIRAEFASGLYSKAELARKYGIAESTASAILSGKTWKHLLPGNEKRPEGN